MKPATMVLFAGLLSMTLTAGYPANQPKNDRAELQLQAAIKKETVDGDLKGAIELYRKITQGGNRPVAAKALMQIGRCHEKLGNVEARKAYEQLIREFSDQSEVAAQARSRLAVLGRGSSPTPSMLVRRVYEGLGVDWCNGLSSDGRYMTYTDWDTGDVAVVDLVTAQHRRLTNKGPWGKSPKEFGECSAFSPDDKRIAYYWQKDGVSEVRVIGFDGSNPRVLYRNESYLRPYEWSSDGKQILMLVVKNQGLPQIALLSVVDGTVRTVKEVQARNIEINLSPDARYIAYSMPTEPKSSKRDVFIMKSDGSDHAPLVTHAADDYLLGWAPDGRKILFASDRTGAYAAWSLDVSGGRAQGFPEMVKADFNKVTPVRLAPNGVLYYSLGQNLSDVYIASIDPDTGRMQGAPAAVKARYSGANRTPDWSPDGARLAYRTIRGASSVWDAPAMISILDVRAGQERQITPELDTINPSDGPRWAPDGRSLLVIGGRGEEKGAYRVDVESGATTALAIFPPGQYTLHAVWSPDARTIFYPQGNPTRILRRDLDTAEEVELARMIAPAYIPLVALSPDGKWLAFTSSGETRKGRKLNVVPSAGGQVREIYNAEDAQNISSLGWTPDGRFIWFKKVIRGASESDNPARQEVWRVSPDGSNLRKLELDFRGLEFRLHPDGRQIAFTSGQSKAALWVLENFLPAKAKSAVPRP